MTETNSLSQTDFVTAIIPMIDRLIKPVTERMDTIDRKLDQAITLAADVATAKTGVDLLNSRLGQVEASKEVLRSDVSELKANHRIYGLAMAWVGAPVTVALILAGVVSLFHIHIPGVSL